MEQTITLTAFAAGVAVYALLAGRNRVLRWGASFAAVFIVGAMALGYLWYTNSHPSDRNIDAALSKIIDADPMTRMLSRDDPSFLSGAREVLRKDIVSGDKTAAMKTLFDYTIRRLAAAGPTMRKAGDATMGDLGAQMVHLIGYLETAQPELCARLLLGTPYNLKEYPPAVRDQFEKYDAIEAKAYVEGKNAPEGDSPAISTAKQEEDLATKSLADALPNFTPDEIDAVRDPSRASPRVLCAAYGKWFVGISTQPKAEAATIWRIVLFPQTP